MNIINIGNKRDYFALLLLADEQENMIDLYLDRGTMYVLEDGGIVSCNPVFSAVCKSIRICKKRMKR